MQSSNKIDYQSWRDVRLTISPLPKIFMIKSRKVNI